MKELDIKWLQEYAEQEKRYKWGKQIKLLLTAYEKEKEKNKRLEEFIKNGEYTWKQKYNETFNYVKSEFISKDKIKAKIEELEKEITEDKKKNDDFWSDYSIYLDAQREGLQSLLEKE